MCVTQSSAESAASIPLSLSALCVLRAVNLDHFWQHSRELAAAAVQVEVGRYLLLLCCT